MISQPHYLAVILEYNARAEMPLHKKEDAVVPPGYCQALTRNTCQSDRSYRLFFLAILYLKWSINSLLLTKKLADISKQNDSVLEVVVIYIYTSWDEVEKLAKKMLRNACSGHFQIVMFCSNIGRQDSRPELRQH